MSRVRQLKVSFHRVIVTNPETPLSFGQILGVLNDVPNDERRTHYTADEPVRLRYLHAVTGGWLGDMTRIRLHEAIDKSTTKGIETQLEFAEDEGPCEKTAFFFHPATKVLAIQQSPGGVSASSCARYFKALGRVRKIELPIIIKEEALERIVGMHTISKFQIKLAGIENAARYRSRDEASKQMIGFLRKMRAPVASISVEIDEEIPTLARIANLVKDAMGWRDQGMEVKKIVVVGSEGDADERVAIDLFQDRIVESIPVELKDGERIKDNDRYSAVRTAWNRQREAMEQRFHDTAHHVGPN